VAFQFKKATCVVAGTFNMYIVQPQWLTKIGVFETGTKVGIWTKFDEPGFRFQPQDLPNRWYVTPNRIEIETDSPAENCGQKMATVLASLPWTPLLAIGNNTVYEAPVSELDELSDLKQFSPAPPAEFRIAQRSLVLALMHGEQLYNLQLSLTDEVIELSVNVHTELGNKESQYSQEAARNFLNHRETAEFLIANVLKARINHVASNIE
jgi:hypothetical protein